MHARVIVAGAITGGALIFLWGALVNAALPLPGATPRTFTNDQQVVETIKSNAPGNGIYLSDKGVFAAVDMRPDGSVRVPSLGPLMLRELLADLAIGLLLTIVLLHVKPRDLPRPLVLAAAALAGGLAIAFSDWNWFGFSTGFTMAVIVEVVVGWTLVGLVLTKLIGRLSPAMA